MVQNDNGADSFQNKTGFLPSQYGGGKTNAKSENTFISRKSLKTHHTNAKEVFRGMLRLIATASFMIWAQKIKNISQTSLCFER